MSQSLAPALAEASHRQSRSVRDLGLACCAYLLFFSACVLLWLPHIGLRLDAAMLGACALSPLLALALAWLDRSEARQYTLHMLVAMLALPVALLFSAGALDTETWEVPPAAPSLDAQALFDGAASVQDADVRGGGLVLLRAGRFADGSELRLSRFADVAGAENQLAMLAQAMPTEPFTDAGRKGLLLRGQGVGEMVVIVVERHGPDVLELRAGDRGGVLARLAAQRVPAPQDAVVAAPVQPAASWPFFTVMAMVHGLAFVAFIAWAGSHTTRVPALRDATVVTPGELRARLLSLARPVGPFAISPLELEGGQALRIDASPGARRTHHITLHIDAGRGCVRVHEKLGIDGDAPEDADEASMRSAGDAQLDAARPPAQTLWSAAVQATMVLPSRLAAVPLRLQGRRAALPPDYAASLDGEGVLTVLCALVTRSGWDWQPRLFGRHV